MGLLTLLEQIYGQLIKTTKLHNKHFFEPTLSLSPNKSIGSHTVSRTISQYPPSDLFIDLSSGE